MWLLGSLQEILPTKAQGSQQRGQRDVEWRKRRRSGEEAGREVEGRARRGKVPRDTVLGLCSVRKGSTRTSSILPTW